MSTIGYRYLTPHHVERAAVILAAFENMLPHFEAHTVKIEVDNGDPILTISATDMSDGGNCDEVHESTNLNTGKLTRSA